MGISQYQRLFGASGQLSRRRSARGRTIPPTSAPPNISCLGTLLKRLLMLWMLNSPCSLILATAWGVP
ncbi:MAG: hypothetical protein AMJ81_02400 [Phycisphaerae bacterium SM23_33]|nr:MAG: hypothetical protein AMJ81_02400 [Phycisphaerae bacterium SM23_33]